jgi:excinuclease ABC subunit A
MPSQESIRTDSETEFIRVRGARTHNLKNIDVDIPHGKLVVITGPSGSGKSSLAMDTLFAEGQRQYIESLSLSARQAFDQIERPEVDRIENLGPTICIQQRRGPQSPRSTVATITEIYDYLRLLMARLATPACPHCGQSIRQQTPDQIVERLLRLPPGTKLILFAPLAKSAAGNLREQIALARKSGFVRVRVDQEVYELDQVSANLLTGMQSLDAVVDRLVIREGLAERLAESILLALKTGSGAVSVAKLLPGQNNADWQEELYSTQFACPSCDYAFAELEPRTFSFNSPYGACSTCAGLGRKTVFDPDEILGPPSEALAGNLVLPWREYAPLEKSRCVEEFVPYLARWGVSADVPWGKWPEESRRKLLFGDDSCVGLLTLLEKTYSTETNSKRKAQLEAFRAELLCPDCGGTRLRPEARACQLLGKAIHEISALSIKQAQSWFAGLVFPPDEVAVARPILSEIERRLQFLMRVGLEYLTLDRPADSLSGGEYQRVRLATGIGSGLVGICYILDEPSIGLHPRDNRRLIESLRDLQRQGNSVIVVEHDREIMIAADYLVDLGPGAGVHGGSLLAANTPGEVAKNTASVTGPYLSPQTKLQISSPRRSGNPQNQLRLTGATLHNLQNVGVEVPLGRLVCVTGVSGSGKSSLVAGTLVPAVARALGQGGPRPGPFLSLSGEKPLRRLQQVDQSPLGRTPRSNPATATGAWDAIRHVFAQTKQARTLGFRASRFSFNAAGGRCEACQGMGIKRITLGFLPDLVATCSVCHGKRFEPLTLSVLFHQHSVADVLDLSVHAARELFADYPKVARPLEALREVGLGYLTLGQSATTLSGGESQRIKLAAELAKPETESTLFVFDEPTTGLHFVDVARLIAIFQRLVDAGHSVLVIEHHLEVIAAADWVIDLGPEGGDHGGHVVVAGSPEQIAKCERSHTGRALHAAFQGS